LTPAGEERAPRPPSTREPRDPEQRTTQLRDPEQRTTPVELLWDLVFAFAITQVTTLLAEARLGAHPDPVLAAADGYSYLHLPIVAGVIIFAVGAKLLVRGSVSDALADPARLALCGGIALYLLAHAAFALRLGATVSADRVLAAAALLALEVLAGALAGWAVCLIAAAIVAVMCARETRGAVITEV
jgi:low temperature requirement protein LtrA